MWVYVVYIYMENIWDILGSTIEKKGDATWNVVVPAQPPHWPTDSMQSGCSRSPPLPFHLLSGCVCEMSIQTCIPVDSDVCPSHSGRLIREF